MTVCWTVSLLVSRISLTCRAVLDAGAATTVTGAVPLVLTLVLPSTAEVGVVFGLLSSQDETTLQSLVVFASPSTICSNLLVVSRFTLHPPRRNDFYQGERRATTTT